MLIDFQLIHANFKKILRTLAGVTVRMVVGDDGVIGTTRDAVSAYEIAELKEELEQSKTAAYVAAARQGKRLTAQIYAEQLAKNGIISDAEQLEATGESGQYRIRTEDGYLLTIQEAGNGKVEVTVEEKVDDADLLKIESVEEVSTTAISANVTVKTVNGESITYFYKVGNDTEYTTVNGQTGATASFTINGLEYNASNKVIIKASSTGHGTAYKTIYINLGDVNGGNSGGSGSSTQTGAISFASEWSNVIVKVTIS